MLGFTIICQLKVIALDDANRLRSFDDTYRIENDASNNSSLQWERLCRDPLCSTQPLAEMSTGIFLGGKGRPTGA
jgi:hypothetical protein